MMFGEWAVNPRPLPASAFFRWNSPVLWNRELRNCGPFLTKYINEHAVTKDTDESRENIRAAMVMCAMEAEPHE